MHRACTPCVSVAAKASQLVQRVADLARHVNEAQEPQLPAAVKAVTLDDAINAIDSSMERICVSRASAAVTLHNVNLRLQAAGREDKPTLEKFIDEVAETPGQVEARLDEVVECTDAAAGLVEARLAQLEVQVAAERKLRVSTEAKAAEAEERRGKEKPASPRSTSTANSGAQASLGRPSLKSTGSEQTRGARMGKCLSRRGVRNSSASWA